MKISTNNTSCVKQSTVEKKQVVFKARLPELGQQPPQWTGDEAPKTRG